MRAFVAVLLMAVTALAADVEVWVDAVHGDDLGGAGSEVSPYRTVSHAVLALGSGPGAKTVHVLPGLYDAALGEVFPIVLPSDTSILGSGSHQTVLNGGGSGTLVRLAPRALLSDLSLQRAAVGVESTGLAFGDGALRCLRRCVLRNHDVGVSVSDDLHSDHGVVLLGCLLTKNVVALRAQSHDNDFQSVTVQVYGSTITGNDIALESLGPGAERYLGLFDSIVRGNGVDDVSGWLAFVPGVTGNVLGDASLVGVDGNVDVDPGFVAAAAADVHLRASSPVLDLGGPPAAWPPHAQWIPLTAWIWEADYADVTDLDGDLRDVVDPGADERSEPSLYAQPRPALGGTLGLRAQGAPSSAPLVALALDLLPSPALGGALWLAPPLVILGALPLDADGVGGWTIPLPSDPLLEGVDVYLQDFAGGPGAWQGSPPLWARLVF